MIALPENLGALVAGFAHVPWPPREPAELRAFVERCAAESLFPLFFATAPGNMQSQLETWRALATANRRRSEAIQRMVDRVPSLVGEEFIYLKGSDYSRRLYSSPELRPQNDIDVLVPRGRFASVVARLASEFPAVYQRRSHRSSRWPDRAFDLGAVTLELHHSFVQRSRARIDYEAVWRGRQPFLDAARLDDVDAMLVSVINIAKDDLATTLLRYLDLWLMLRADPSLFDRAALRAREWRIANAFHIVLGVTIELFEGLRVPLRRRALLDRLVSPRAVARKREGTRLQKLWRKWWLIDGVARRAWFALDTAAMAFSAAASEPRAE